MSPGRRTVPARIPFCCIKIRVKGHDPDAVAVATEEEETERVVVDATLVLG
jgi:hypothetical protein